MRRIPSATVVMTAVLLTLAACGSSSSASRSGSSASAGSSTAAPPASSSANSASQPAGSSAIKPINLTIGALLPFTGSLAPVSPPIVKAVKLAATVANSAAKTAGIPLTVKVTSGDTQGSTADAVQAAGQLVSGGASCLVGPATTGAVTAVLSSVTLQPRVPMVVLAGGDAVSSLKDQNTVFRVAMSDEFQASALYSYVKKTLGGSVQGKTIAVAYLDGAYGQDFATALPKLIKADGGNVVGPIGYDASTTNFNSVANKIVSGNPDAYIVIDFPATFAKLAPALLRTGKFDPSKLFVPATLYLPTPPDSIPAKALEGAHAESPGNPTNTAQAKGYDQQYAGVGDKVARGGLDSTGFDSAMLCILSAVRADSAQGPDIARNFVSVTHSGAQQLSFLDLADAFKLLASGQDIDYAGVVGPIAFNGSGDNTTSLYDFATYKSGKLVVDYSTTLSANG